MQIFVLGMHRSGTSVLARVLNLMGVYFGTENVSTGASQENPKGFWERRDVRMLNDTILHTNGCDWDRLADFDLEAIPARDLSVFEASASKIILNMDAHRPWFLKEPRFCILFPVWRKSLEVPLCIHIYRNPLEVAQSLQKRNDVPIEVGLALWEAYNVAALRASNGLARLLVPHSQLIAEPLETVNAIHDTVMEHGGYSLRIPHEREIEGFIDGELYRERQDHKALAKVAGESQLALFDALERSTDLSELEIQAVSDRSQEVLRAYESLHNDMAERVRKANARIDLEQGFELQLRLKTLELDHALTSLKVADSQHNASEKRVQGLLDTNHTLEMNVALLKQKIEIETKATKQRERELGARRKEAVEQQRRLRQSRDEAQALQRQTAEKLERAREGRQTMQTKHQELSREIDVLRDTEKSLTSDVAALRSQDAALRSQVAALQSEVAALERQEVEHEQAYMDQIGVFQESLERVKDELDQRTEELVVVRDESAYQQKKRFEETALLTQMLLEREERMAASRSPVRRLLSWLQRSRLTRPLRIVKPAYRRFRADLQLLERSEMFDRDWYLQEYPDVAGEKISAQEHYLRFGAIEGRKPGPRFDTVYYLQNNPDVAASGVNPLLHYLKFGEGEGRRYVP